METPKHIRTLEKTGFTRDQAETHVQVTTELMGRHMNKFATKEDYKKQGLEISAIKQDLTFIRMDIVRIEKKTDDLHDAFRDFLKDFRDFKSETRNNFKETRNNFKGIRKDIVTDVTRAMMGLLASTVVVLAAIVSIAAYFFS